MKKFSLLYVDDEESNLRIFKDTFRRKFNVYTAISAKEGIKILDTHEIDLVLSDQRMPGMTGVEFLKYTLEKFPEPNRILITGYSDIEAIESAINTARIFQYVQKPWNEENLLNIIENALNIYHLEQENKRQKEELIIAKEKAEESNRLKTEFINNLSHEIRTPMNGIIGFSELLNQPNLSKEKSEQYIKIIINSSNQLLRIIDDILEISRLGTKQVKSQLKKVCLNSLLLELFLVFDIKAKENNTSLYLKTGLLDRESTILTDESKLKKILCNLLENALKFTRVGFIEFGYKLIDNELEFYVKDTGKGINSDKQAMIFDRFSKEEDEFLLNYEGLGLGLSIAKENAELIEGKITLKSEKGKGSTFFITIPYKPVSIATESSSGDLGKKEIKGTPKEYTILIVEDEEINYLYLEELLKDIIKINYKILFVNDGQEAVDICKNNLDIDLVLMDIKLPVMNGFEATRLIKEFRPKLPIVAQTAYTSITEKNEAKLARCDDFITKPISKEILIKLIKKYLMTGTEV